MAITSQRFSINGVKIPTPDKMTFGIEDLSSEETGRDLAGTMHKDVVSVKDYYSCEWKILSDTDASLLFSLTDGKTQFSFHYRDPRGGWSTGTFYCGKREGEMNNLSSSKRTFSNVKMQFTRI